MSQTDDRLGKFSISLAMKDLEASCTFYQKLGFEVVVGSSSRRARRRSGS